MTPDVDPNTGEPLGLDPPKGFQTLKNWKIDQAAKEGISTSGIENSIAGDRYPNLIFLRKNKRVIYVKDGS